MTPLMTASLRIIAASIEGETPAGIARQLGPLAPPASFVRHGTRVSGRTQTAASKISPALRALETRGYVRVVARPDGLVGHAYAVTAAGRTALRGIS